MKIGIIGAGVAGLTAAEYLLKNHPECDVTILEAEDRIGGRVFTDQSLGFALEYGANWLSSKDLQEKALMKKFEIVETKTSSGFFEYNKFYHNGDLVDLTFLDDLHKYLYTLVRFALLLPFNVRWSSLFRLAKIFNLKKDQNWGLDLIYSFIGKLSQEDTCNLRVSPNYFEHVGDEFVVKDGLINMYNGILEKISPVLNTKVKSIDYSGKNVSLDTTNGAYEFDKVLVTVSLGVLKNSNITFNPILPAWKQSAIKNIGISQAEKYFYFYTDKFFDDSDIIGVINEDITCLFFNIGKVNGQNLLLEFVHSSELKKIADFTEDELIDRNYKILESVYGDKTLRAYKVIKSNWTTNENFLGTYSHHTIITKKNDRVNLGKPLCDKVYFAGEAISVKNTGYMDGAIETAIAACKEMLL